VTTLTTTYQKGRGKNKVTTANKKSICNLCKIKPFFRLASKLSGAASALKDHIEQKHYKYKETKENHGKSKQPTSLQKYLKSAKEILPFEEALVN
jgi:hypothetical protein